MDRSLISGSCIRRFGYIMIWVFMRLSFVFWGDFYVVGIFVWFEEIVVYMGYFEDCDLR